MLLDDECPEYNLFVNDEREEFIFRIFQMLVLGGILCQYEDILDPYLDVTKVIYKDLIRFCNACISISFAFGTNIRA